jgi:hypothetical protein
LWRISVLTLLPASFMFWCISCFLQHGPFPDLLRSFSPSGSLRVYDCFSIDSSLFLRIWRIHRNSHIIICNIIILSRIAYFTTNFCSECINLFYFPNSVVVWVVMVRRVFTVFKTNVEEAYRTITFE